MLILMGMDLREVHVVWVAPIEMDEKTGSQALKLNPHHQLFLIYYLQIASQVLSVPENAKLC